MKLLVRQTFANEYVARDAELGDASPTGLGNTPAEAEDDLMRQLGCKAFDCTWPDCECGRRK